MEQLQRLLDSGSVDAPLSRAALDRVGAGSLWAELAWLGHLDRVALSAIFAVAIAERQNRKSSHLELVWTGPEAKVSSARDTAVVLRHLFGQATKSVLLAGYSFTQGGEILEPLFEAMRDRGVRAEFFLHLDDRPNSTSEESARLGVERFLLDNWPFGSPRPALFYDPRTTAPGSSINLHAKCVVVDERWTLLGSANFTHNAHARNIELGVLIDDAQFAEDVSLQWRSLISAQLVTRWPS
jgi:phosphatidylserine/phosphatidylglycerophosphate/cardiolipin synthase-like enzyme